MSAVITPTRPSAIERLRRAAVSACLHFDIGAMQQHIDECARQNIIGTATLRGYEARIAEHRARLVMIGCLGRGAWFERLAAFAGRWS